MRFPRFITFAITAIAVCLSCAPGLRAQDACALLGPETLPGRWVALHPEWRGDIVFYADGTYVRPYIGGGKWEFLTENDTYSLVLKWNQWGTEKLAVLSPDQARGQQRRGNFRIFRLPNPAPKELPQKPEAAEVEATRDRLKDSTWHLVDRKNFRLNADGTITCDFDERQGAWQVVGLDTIKVEVPWQPTPSAIITTNKDATLLLWTEDGANLALREGI